MKQINNYTLFVENPDEWIESCNKDYLIEEMPRTQIIDNGIILPLKNDYTSQYTGIGGVCDEVGNFVSGHDTSILFTNKDCWFNVYKAYSVPYETNIVKETVVYGGMIYNHFGHFITECLSRMWWLLENITCEHKFIFIIPEHFPDNVAFLDYFSMLGLKKERIIILREPTRFDAVIVPEQSTYIYSGYRANAMRVYDAIRDSVAPASYEKVYFTRTKLSNPDIVGEEYFEDYFRSEGYEIIAPESLSIKEQVSLMAGAKDFACTSGSLHHHILFANDSIAATIINRCRVHPWDKLVNPIHWINQARNANCIYVDACMNFLPHNPSYSTHLVAPNKHWKSYVSHINNLEDTDYNELLQEDYDTNCNDKILEYIYKWCKKIVIHPYENLWWHGRSGFTFADFAITLHELFINELDDSIKRRLKSAFNIDARQKILYGAGYFGRIAWSCYGEDKVYAFADINKHGTEYLGKPVIHPSALSVLSDEYEVVICAEESESMIEYLKNIGVEDFRLFC